MIAFCAKIVVVLFCCNTLTNALCAPEFFSVDRQNIRLAIRHIERGGIGYKKGYSTLEGFFAPNPRYRTLVPFVDLRGHVFDDGKIAANAGIGLRGFSRYGIYGGNVYYDYRDTQKARYKQMGFGFERIGNRWDFRINGYIPTAMKVRACSPVKFKRFAGHSLIVSQKYNFVMRGFNAEFGYHFLQRPSVDLYGAAGPYYFTGKNGPHICGAKLRFGCRFKYGIIELSNSYDKMFRNRFQCLLSFTIPFGTGAKPQRDDAHTSEDVSAFRMTQPVIRQEIIVEGCKKCNTPAINPATGLPYTFVFVDNTSHSEGTFRSPYPTLTLAQDNSHPGDIIYVFPGDGTTKGMNVGIVLQNNQKFWGSGTRHALLTTQGTVLIPALSSTAPTITNINDADCVTLAPINEVSGFTITDVQENSIFGTGLNNIAISDCTIDNTAFLDLIHLEYGAGSGVATINNVSLAHSARDAIFITATAPLACTVQNCVMQNNIRYPITITANQATVNVLDNTVEHNPNGVYLAFTGPSTVLVSGNNINNIPLSLGSSEHPLAIQAGTSPLTATVKNNTISDNLCGGVQFLLNNTNSAQLTVSNNTLNNNAVGASGATLGSSIVISPNTTTSGNCTLQLNNNVISNNEGSALYCTNGDFNSFEVHATGNTVIANGGSGFTFDNACTSFVLTAQNNTISNGANAGISTSNTIVIADANMTLANNQITGNTTSSASGVNIAHDGTNFTLNITDNNLSDNEGSGISVYPATGIENITANIANNTINDNQNGNANAAGGIHLEQFTNLSATLTNNSLSNNDVSKPGVYINSAIGTPSACITMSGNSCDTGYTIDSGTGTFNLAPCNVDSVNSGVITEVGTVNSVQSCPAATPCT